MLVFFVVLLLNVTLGHDKFDGLLLLNEHLRKWKQQLNLVMVINEVILHHVLLVIILVWLAQRYAFYLDVASLNWNSLFKAICLLLIKSLTVFVVFQQRYLVLVQNQEMNDL